MWQDGGTRTHPDALTLGSVSGEWVQLKPCNVKGDGYKSPFTEVLPYGSAGKTDRRSGQFRH